MEIKGLIFTFFYLILTVASDEDDNVYLRIEQGLLRGKKMISRNGRQFYGFLKIPYAEPPLGQLRFKVSPLNDFYLFFFLRVSIFMLL